MTKSKQINTTVKELQSQNELILRAAGEGIYGLDADGKTTNFRARSLSAAWTFLTHSENFR